ncbi:hypothetical protein GCK72_018908 [Caenorhabditis remanei]|uniref:G-protein coupled receptors family 1 profile domain-containing protein n=1 Tax=Caenorhabditis remanei TaxID=31234 RepID=A0A6A5GCC8_CAERE|nr:hypothetical protein GCK72_018908 [Caenorhabditis remanei]KAF1752354.1 hypothetical protein GCK72_018908 [Caenorhabditis remanei]
MPTLDVPIDEFFGDIPESTKTGLYYTVVTLFVISTLASTLLSAAFLVLSIALWSHFKPILFFWFLSQLTFSVFVLSASNLLINVPATLSLLSKDVADSAIFKFISYLIDFCHYSIIFSNLIIAVQRGFVFFLRDLTDTVFNPPIIYVWLALVWVLSYGVEYILMSSNCSYRYEVKPKRYEMKCESVAQSSLIVNSATPAGIQLKLFFKYYFLR